MESLTAEQKHRHKFAIWAAARASQRGFAESTLLREALENSGVVSFAIRPNDLDSFDKLHKKWCSNICRHLKRADVQKSSYGRAAKLVNVYLKSMVVLNNLYGGPARVIHPPIDRMLLHKIASSNKDITDDVRKLFKRVAWTSFDKRQYFKIINVLRSINGTKPFWMVEAYWEPTK